MITIVVGGQYGGEGKGKISAFLAREGNYAAVCRCGGANSSHTVIAGGIRHRLRMMPTAAAGRRDFLAVFGAGTLLHLPTLFQEVEALRFPLDRIVIDPNAGIISDDLVEQQRADERYQALGSTLTGTGYASAERCRRRLTLARDIPALQPHLRSVPDVLSGFLSAGRNILLEGHQGAALSNYHGDYPYTSSRDCTAPSMLAECGVGLGWPTSVVLVAKAFPTRNHQGALPGEMSTTEVSAMRIVEFGGGSWGIADRQRRVGTFDLDDLRRAVVLNGPSIIAMTGLDYLNEGRPEMSVAAETFVGRIERNLLKPVGIVSFGPLTEQTHWRLQAPAASELVNALTPSH